MHQVIGETLQVWIYKKRLVSPTRSGDPRAGRGTLGPSRVGWARPGAGGCASQLDLPVTHGSPRRKGSADRILHGPHSIRGPADERGCWRGGSGLGRALSSASPAQPGTDGARCPWISVLGWLRRWIAGRRRGESSMRHEPGLAPPARFHHTEVSSGSSTDCSSGAGAAFVASRARRSCASGPFGSSSPCRRRASTQRSCSTFLATARTARPCW
jgi:hypothetical protein